MGYIENPTNILESDKALTGLKRYERTHSQSWRTRAVIDAVFGYHFVDPNLRS